MPDQPLLTLSKLHKHYGQLAAVDDVSLQIQPGEIFALLGPNGAGKTTLIGCVTGLITRFEGDISIAGLDIRAHTQRTRRLVGLVPQELNGDGFFSIEETLRYQGGYFGITPSQDKSQQLLKAFSLWDKRHQSSRALSGGMKRRLMICKALVHDPLLLFLDEPTAGVDVELREELWEYVRQLRRAGTTIVLTTHYLEEAEQLADRIGILNQGKLLQVQPRDQLLQQHGRQRLELQLDQPPPEDLLEDLRPLATSMHQPGPRQLHLQLRDDLDEVLDDCLRAIHKHQLVIHDLQARRSSLEEIFRELIAEDLTS